MADSDQEKHEDEPRQDAAAEQKKAAATKSRPRRSPKRKPAPSQPLPLWKVILHNDDVNEVGHVVRTIRMLTPLGEHEAAKRTLEAHETGAAMLLTTHRERAELYRDQFASRKLTVTIEPDQP